MKEIPVGTKGKYECVVTEENTAASLGSGFLPVFGTPYLCACFEGACLNSISEFMDEGEGSVGTAINIRHTAATPIGMKIFVESEVTAVDGRKISFVVRAFDDAGPVGEAAHERFVINNEKFMKKANGKINK